MIIKSNEVASKNYKKSLWRMLNLTRIIKDSVSELPRLTVKHDDVFANGDL